MKQYTVTSLLVGKVIRDRHYEKCHCNPDMGRLVTRPVNVYVVRPEGGGDVTLINAGCPSAADGPEVWAPKEFNQPLPEGGGPESIEKALASVGVTPGDVKRIILTHLHIEDCWNIDLFPDAQVVVQRTEIEAAFVPPSWQRLLYPKRIALDIQGRRKPSQCLFLWGDTELEEGITILHTPGFTHGTQTPVINTAKGRVAITAAGGTYANWWPNDGRFGFPLKPMQGTVNIPGTFVAHPWLVTREMERIRANSDIVVPIHEECAPRVMPDEWWDCPDDAHVEACKQFADAPFVPGAALY